MNYQEFLKRLSGIEQDRVIDRISLLSKIEKIENSYYFDIPNDYLLFLKEIEKWVFSKTIGIKSKELIPIATESLIVSVNFLNIDKLLLTIENYEGNLPINLLPIAEGEPGDLIVIDLSSEHYGKVYYWFHEHDSSSNGLYLLSENFNEFIKELSIVPENDISIEDVSIVKVSNKFLDRLKKRTL